MCAAVLDTLPDDYFRAREKIEKKDSRRRVLREAMAGTRLVLAAKLSISPTTFLSPRCARELTR